MTTIGDRIVAWVGDEGLAEHAAETERRDRIDDLVTRAAHSPHDSDAYAAVLHIIDDCWTDDDYTGPRYEVTYRHVRHRPEIAWYA